MSCPNDTNHDGDCHLCHRLPGGCFLRDVAAPLQNIEPPIRTLDPPTQSIGANVQRDHFCLSSRQIMQRLMDQQELTMIEKHVPKKIHTHLQILTPPRPSNDTKEFIQSIIDDVAHQTGLPDGFTTSD